MTDQSAYGGLFQDPPYLSSDPDPNKSDPYDKQDCISSRYLGKNMMTGGASCPGQYPTDFFEKEFLTLSSNEQNAQPYATNDKAARRRAAEAAKHPAKPISDSEFRYTSFPSKSTGAGSYYGCFQNRPYEYDVDPSANATKQEKKLMQQRAKAAAAAAEEAKRVSALPNIKTSPPKKGTYGVPGTLLSNEVYDDNWRADMDGDEKKKRKAAAVAAEHEGKPMGGPFRVSAVSKAYLDELTATGVSGVYTAYVAPEDPRSKRKKKQKPPPPEPTSIHEKPFYGGIPRSGERSCLNPFPNTWFDVQAVEEADRKKAAKRRNKKKEVPMPTRPKGADEWKPNSFGHTSVISSCLRRFY